MHDDWSSHSGPSALIHDYLLWAVVKIYSFKYHLPCGFHHKHGRKFYVIARCRIWGVRKVIVSKIVFLSLKNTENTSFQTQSVFPFCFSLIFFFFLCWIYWITLQHHLLMTWTKRWEYNQIKRLLNSSFIFCVLHMHPYKVSKMLYSFFLRCQYSCCVSAVPTPLLASLLCRNLRMQLERRPQKLLSSTSLI